MSSPIEQLEGVRPAGVYCAPREKGRVLMLSTDLGFGGGAEEQVMSLSLGLRARGWLVHIISLVPPSPLPAEIESSDIEIASLNMRRGLPDPRALIRLHRHLRRFRPHVIHSHMTHANLLARVVRVVHPAPVLINTLHSMTMEKVSGGSGRGLEIGHRLTDGLTDLTTVICRAAVQGYVRSGAVREGRIDVLYNGVDTRRFQFDLAVRRRMREELGVEGLFVWLAAGRLELAKDYPTLIRSFADLIKRGGNPAVLLICGQGSLETQLHALVRECRIEEHVRFLGVRTDIPPMLSAADAYVMSSANEGLPMVLLEASASGLPIVATSAGGNSEVVVHGKTGFVVPPGDPGALSSAMRRMAGLTAAERDAMASAGRAHTKEHFDIERILDRWEELYTELIRRRADG